MEATPPVEIHENHVLLRLASLGDDPAASFAEIERALESKPRLLAVDCATIDDLDADLLRALLRTAIELRRAQKPVRLFSVTRTLSRQLAQAGLAEALKTTASLKSALEEIGAGTARTFDVETVNPFLNATIEVLKVQASTEIRPKAIFVRREKSGLGDISGVIGLVSDRFNGSVVLTFPKDTFLKLMSRMLGETYTEITQDIQDGVSEPTNIIFGHAKAALNQKGYGVKMALPSIVVGENHFVYSGTLGPRVVVPFDSDLGPFFIEICLS